MKSTAESVKSFLIDEGVGSATYSDNWFISIAGSPDQDKTIMIRDTVGDIPEYGMNDKTSEEPIYKPSFQIIVKSLDYSDGFNKVSEIRNALRETLSYATDSSSASVAIRYTSFVAKSGVFFAGLDESERYTWDMNYRSFRKEG